MLTDSLRALAPFMRQDLFIGFIVGLLVVATVISGCCLHGAAGALRRHLKDATKRLTQSEDATAFAVSYEAVSAEFAADRLLGAAWCGFVQSLIVPAVTGRPVTATANPRRWFELSGLFREAGCDLRYHAALPGLLVGAGLLFTFLGLAAALSAAGGVVAEGVAQSARNEALRDLLGAASVKFLTSLTGLLLSIGYALFRKAELKATQRAEDRFIGAVEERLPFRSAASFQAETNLTLANQYTEIQRIGTDFIVNLGGILERAFDQGLQQHIGPLATALEKLSGRLGSQNEDAMKAMLEAFTGRLQGAVGENMTGTAAALETLSSSLDGLHGGLDAAARKMGQAAEDMASGMGRGTQAAMAGIGEQMGALMGSLREAGADSTAALTAAIGRAADSLETTAAKVAATLDGGAADASGRLIAATEAMRDDLRGVLDRFGTSLAESGTALTSGARASSDALQTASAALGTDLSGAAARLREAGEAAGQALREGGSEARTGLTEAARLVLHGSTGLGERLAGLGAASAALAEQAAGLDRAVGAAAGPLTTGAADLRAAGEAAREATTPLRDVAVSVRDASVPLAEASAALAEWQRGAMQLAGSVSVAAERFDGLDQGLANTLRGLNDGLSGFRQQIEAFVGKIDEGFAKSVTGLHGVAKSLENTADELGDLGLKRRAG